MKSTHLSVLFALLAALACVTPASAQTNAQDDEDSFDPNAEMSQKDADAIAKFIFAEDIKAGRLTAQKAGKLFKCANERYAKILNSNPDKYVVLMEATEKLTDDNVKLTAAEKEKYERAYKEAFKFQKEAEDGCRKEIGIDPSVKRVFTGFGK